MEVCEINTSMQSDEPTENYHPNLQLLSALQSFIEFQLNV